MPIDIDQLKLLVKVASAVPQDKGSQAMAAAAQAAKPAGGIPLPKTIEEESPAEGVLSAEQQQREQEKLEQQRRKEIEAKENEIRGLQHELDLERVERQKMTNRHELDMQMRQEEAKLKAEKDRLEKERFQLVQEKARQDNMFKAEEMRHQATLDKATFKQEAEIAKAQAKSTADMAKQQAQMLIATNEKARQASDKYYAEASSKLNQSHPAISPALQSQLDGAIASLDRFRKVHNKQLALPKPGTPPDLTKLATIKWAEDAVKSAAAPSAEYMDDPDMSSRNVYEGGSAYDAIRAAAYFNNQAAIHKHDGSEQNYNYYTNLANRAKAIAQKNYQSSKDKGDRALYDSYMDSKSTINGLASHKDYRTTESQFDRDSNAFADEQALQDYKKKGGPAWYHHLYDYTLGALYDGLHNSITDAAANSRNAERFGADRWGDTTFEDPSTRDAYYKSINEQGYGDSAWGDLGNVTLNTVGTALAAIPAGGMASAGGRAAARAALSGATRAAIKRTANNAARAVPGIIRKPVTLAAKPVAAALNSRPGRWLADPKGWKAELGLAGGLTAYGAMSPYDPERQHINYDMLTPGWAPYALQHQFSPGWFARDIYEQEPMYKAGSVAVPMPGDKPVMVKKANDSLVTQTANDYYDSTNFNSAYYRNPYSRNSRFLGDLINTFTGGLIKTYPYIGKHEMYLNPQLPLHGPGLMRSVIADAGHTGSSNVHKVIANAAAAKHAYKPIENTNATTYRPSTVSGRTFAAQLSNALS